jgi:hypothetical protein
MAEIQQGIAVVWAISSTIAAIGSGSPIGSRRITGQTAGREADTVEHRGTDGDVVGVTTFNQRETLELTIYPSGATRLLAQAQNILPLPGAVLLVIDSLDTDVGAGSPGKPYYVVSSSKVKGLEDKCVMTVSLARWAGVTTADATYTPIAT